MEEPSAANAKTPTPFRPLWRRILLPRFSLRTLLIMTTLFSFAAAYFGNLFYQASQQRRAVELYNSIRFPPQPTTGKFRPVSSTPSPSNEIVFYYDYQFDKATTNFTRDAVGGSGSSNVDPKLIEYFGIDMFHNVVRVDIEYSLLNGGKSQPVVRSLETLPRLQNLSIQTDSKKWLTDVSPTIHRLKRLKELDLSFYLHQLTAADADSWRDIAGLRRLWLGGFSGYTVPIDVSLISLPDLEELELSIIDLQLSGVDRFPTLPKLKRLTMKSSRHNLSEEFFAALVKQCPALESFEFRGVIEPQIIKPLNNHATLKSLKIRTAERLRRFTSEDYRAALPRIKVDYNQDKLE